ncbi:glycosyltransferase family 2 protein [Rhodococcus opacus]|uniref:glycosyltransferase family 2 protein n=1 Tax=Rhodococcus opacus TaxID=37919 RepID=UPI0024B9D02A|nr:glycosyltransferase [Rhodococcus opacus]MDJ0414392.1 glycosyltransferase [Rhodococcus opacus]
MTTLSIVAICNDGSSTAARAATEESFRTQGPGPWKLSFADLGRTPSERVNTAVRDGPHGHIAVIEAGDRLEPGALAAVLELLKDSTAPDVAYTDEQWPGQIFPKPRWIPRYLEAYPYLGRLCFVRKALFEAVGGWSEDHAPALEWDFTLRIAERTTNIAHVPILGVMRAHEPPTDRDFLEAGRRAVAARYKRAEVPVTVELTGGAIAEEPEFVRVWRHIPDPPPLVSIVIPTGGGRRNLDGRKVVLVANALRSLVERTTYERWQVVLVPSEGTDAAVVAECGEILGDRLRVVPVAGPFNFSRSVNTGVGAAEGTLVLLLNDDTEVIEPRWLERMVSVASEDGVGVVGAKLLFADNRIQHTGVIFDGEGIPLHVHIFEDDDTGHFGSKVVDLDFLGVTGACLLVSKSLYEEVGGFTEALPLNFNDVDFCLKVIAAGHTVVCTPFARLRHYESSTREARIHDFELEAMRWWKPRTLADPYVNVRGLV